MWVSLIIAVVSAVLAYALTPAPPTPKPPTLSDIEVPTASQSRAIPVVFGTYLVKSPNVVWYGDLSYEPVYAEGGK